MRRREPIMKDWIFTCRNQQRPVDLPHTWNAVDGQDGGNDYYRGTCSYEKTLSAPVYNAEREEVFLEFEGVNSTAVVQVNGKELITHHGGYSTFRVNVTDELRESNHIKVLASNSVNDYEYPQKADFTFYGGIYRDVNWLVVNRNHFEVEKNGTPGMHVTPQLNEDGTATIGVHADIKLQKNDDDKISEDYTVNYLLVDNEGNVVSSISDEVINEASDSDADSSVRFELAEPHLWNGIKDPYQYSMVARLYKDTELLDEISCSFGIRSIRIDSKKGFFLNGKLYPLHGVSRHQDRKGLGNAISYEMMEQDMQLIREVGANTIRLAHYQHNQYFYDLCDKYGMLVWAEIPYISGHLRNGNENTHEQMKELIIQNYNHPSIFTWGLSNEITINWKDSFGDCLDNHRSLNDLVHSMDPGRPTSMACYAMCTPFHPVTRISDVISWNVYFGWYVPGKFLNDLFMGFFHFIRPHKALGYSEYGAEGMPNLHSAHPKRGDHSEEYQAIYHEYMLRCFKRHPFLWSTYVWNMFDFAADARNQGGEPGMNHKGLITFDRTIRKDSFYIYKAWWSEEPFVHICSKRYQYRTGKKLKIKIYSNQPEVQLFVNEKLIATKAGEHVFEFTVPMEQENHIRAVSGRLVDEATIYHTDLPKPEYKVVKDKNAANWV